MGNPSPDDLEAAVCCEHVLTDGRPFDAGDVARQHHLPLEPTPASVGSARRFVLSELEGLNGADLDSALLLTSELVTNAVLHARTSLCVGVTLAGSRAMIAVADQVGERPRPQERSSTRLGGRGLALVAGLAEDWGAVTTQDGKVVWFTIPAHAPAGCTT